MVLARAFPASPMRSAGAPGRLGLGCLEGRERAGVGGFVVTGVAELHPPAGADWPDAPVAAVLGGGGVDVVASSELHRDLPRPPTVTTAAGLGL
jgi:hypothetical protein